MQLCQLNNFYVSSVNVNRQIIDSNLFLINSIHCVLSSLVFSGLNSISIDSSVILCLSLHLIDKLFADFLLRVWRKITDYGYDL